MTRLDIGVALFAAVAIMAGQAAAKDREPPPAIVAKLLECRAIADASARLSCFDRQVAAVSAAVDAEELVVADRAQVQRAQRSLFGLNLPAFTLFGGSDDPKAQIAEIESTIGETRKALNGNWRFTLADGSRWTQVDGRRIPREPRAGMPIRIRTAAMGSYLANVDKQIAVRVERIN